MKKLLPFILLSVLANAVFAQNPEILVPYRLGNKWGYSDTLGKIKIQPKYENVTEFDYDFPIENNHVIAIGKLNGKELVFTEQQKIIVPPVYDEIIIDEQGFQLIFIIRKNNKKGVYKNGKELLPTQFDSIQIASYDKFLVLVKDKWGLYNSDGKQMIPAIYDEIKFSPFSGPDSWVAIKNGVSKMFSFKTDIADADAPPPSEELMAVDMEGVTFDEKSLMIKHKLDSVKMILNSGIVFKKGKQGIFLEGNDDEFYFFSKHYAVKNIVEINRYNLNLYYPGSKGLIVAELNGKTGIINQDEKQILPFEYDKVEYKGNFFILTKNGKIGFFIIYTHYPIIQPNYDKFIYNSSIPVNSNWSFTLFNIIKDGKEGYVGENGFEFFKD